MIHIETQTFTKANSTITLTLSVCAAYAWYLEININNAYTIARSARTEKAIRDAILDYIAITESYGYTLNSFNISPIYNYMPITF